MQTIKTFFISIKLGFFLALKELKHASLWNTVLIVFIMSLTFLALVGTRGILIGIVDGMMDTYKTHWYGDINLSPKNNKDTIENGSEIVSIAQSLDFVENIAYRYAIPVSLEVNYQNRKAHEKGNNMYLTIWGIDPENEKTFSHLSDLIVEGEFIENDDDDSIILGTNLLHRYNSDDVTLKDVHIGDKVLLDINNEVRYVTVKGILKTKVEEIGYTGLMTQNQVRKMLGRSQDQMQLISIRLNNQASETEARDVLEKYKIDKFAKIETWEGDQPKFIRDMKESFGMIGDVIGGISLVVGAITIFIIIFVNAMSKRQLIGIMKGIGIHSTAIICSFIFQAFFYVCIGVFLSSLFVMYLLKPYFAANPLDLPFADGTLSVDLFILISRSITLLLITILAGYIPAKIIVKKNTLDSILGR